MCPGRKPRHHRGKSIGKPRNTDHFKIAQSGGGAGANV